MERDYRVIHLFPFHYKLQSADESEEGGYNCADWTFIESLNS